MAGVKLLVKAAYRLQDDRNDLSRSTPPGCVVAVRAPNEPFGRMEDKRVWIARGGDPALWPNKWWVIEISDMDVALARKMTGAESTIELQPPSEEGAAEKEIVTHKFKFRVMVNQWPAQHRNNLIENGWIRVPWDTIRPYIRRQKTDAEFTGEE